MDGRWYKSTQVGKWTYAKPAGTPATAVHGCKSLARLPPNSFKPDFEPDDCIGSVVKGRDGKMYVAVLDWVWRLSARPPPPQAKTPPRAKSPRAKTPPPPRAKTPPPPRAKTPTPPRAKTPPPPPRAKTPTPPKAKTPPRAKTPTPPGGPSSNEILLPPLDVSGPSVALALMSHSRRKTAQDSFPFLCNPKLTVCNELLTTAQRKMMYFLATTTMDSTESLRQFVMSFADERKVHVMPNRISFHPFKKDGVKIEIKSGRPEKSSENLDPKKLAQEIVPALKDRKLVVLYLAMIISRGGHALTGVLYVDPKFTQCAMLVIDPNAPRNITDANKVADAMNPVLSVTLKDLGLGHTKLVVKFWSPEGMMPWGPQQAASQAWNNALEELKGQGLVVDPKQARKLQVAAAANNMSKLQKILRTKFAHATSGGQLVLPRATASLSWPLGTCQWWTLWFLFCIVVWPERDVGTVYQEAIEVLTKHLPEPKSDKAKCGILMRFIVRFAMQVLSYQDVVFDPEKETIQINGRTSVKKVTARNLEQQVPTYVMEQFG